MQLRFLQLQLVASSSVVGRAARVVVVVDKAVDRVVAKAAVVAIIVVSVSLMKAASSPRS